MPIGQCALQAAELASAWQVWLRQGRGGAGLGQTLPSSVWEAVLPFSAVETEVLSVPLPPNPYLPREPYWESGEVLQMLFGPVWLFSLLGA